jgi:hypothetical protein
MAKGKILKTGTDEMHDFDLNHMIDFLFMRTYIEDFEKANDLPTH